MIMSVNRLIILVASCGLTPFVDSRLMVNLTRSFILIVEAVDDAHIIGGILGCGLDSLLSSYLLPVVRNSKRSLFRTSH